VAGLKIQKVRAGGESGELGIFLLVGCNPDLGTVIAGPNYRNCRILTYAIAPVSSYGEIRLRALALLLQTSGAGF
jgi:hypothetical protein